ncbi:cbb3-type cytochrome c oxidase N-terminal domain-containing protein [Chitinophaga sp. S165]|uniref:cbb3-type cytochrome c oxidase N-terminal domain-containing protein n=1 Tax=Chitinophaga sp. S165 TaxID=2135462 RepID=UPI000D92751A|nr:cbb3-type cytochrome c oxidase N-terminal domain-containing protein [Chitinophaga sp. S165]PWV53939.1 cytochrome c oxidase cbb3-type subunit 3 [Chitinophaga sp. S165]
MNKRSFTITGFVLFFLCLPDSLPAAAQYKPAAPSELGHPVAIVLMAVITGLLIAIAILGSAVLSSMDIYRERVKNGQRKTIVPIVLLVAGLLSSNSLLAQDETPVQQTVVHNIVSGLSDTSLYLMLSVVSLEILIIFSLLYTLRVLLGIERKKKMAVPGKRVVHWFERLNKTKTLDAASEVEEDMGHEYDGIRELNNPTPPWWRWSFYCSIVFAFVYIWRFQIAHSAPSQLEELAIAEADAKEAKEEYLKNAANNIDENNVTLLTAADDIAGGQKLFSTSCAPCHGAQGQGVVGPNLTDDYWLHGGQVKAVFTTIKYGVPEKGMKSWKDDFSPKQLAMLTSYIKSIHGSNPPDPKEPQGALEKE